MNLFQIALKSIRQRALASSLTALSVALGVMLMVSVLVLSGIIDRAFSQRSIGYHLIVGPARGSDTQLVLSAIYRISPPIENIPYLYYSETLQNEKRVGTVNIPGEGEVKAIVPLAFGDVTEEGGFPIVGTTELYFQIEYAPGRKFRLTKGSKRIGGSFDAIIGSRVAEENGWNLGSQFTIKHGGAQSDHVHDEKFTVVAVLAPTGTANDKTVFLDLDGFFQIAGHGKPIDEAEAKLKDFYAADEQMLARIKKECAAARAEAAEAEHDHGHQHAHAVPDVLKEVTAVLLLMRSDVDAIFFSAKVKDERQVQAVNPIRPMRRLMTDVVGNIRKALVFLTGLIIIVSGVGIFVSIYNSMADRRREIAVMRALGARRQSVFSIILAESVLLCLIGGVLGLLLGHGLVFVAGPYVASQTGLLIDPLSFEPIELVLIPILLALASLVGFIPAMTAYRTDVAKSLAG